MIARAVARHATGRIARRVPALKFLAAAEIAMLVRRHATRLGPHERRRLTELLAQLARRRDLGDEQRTELDALIAKLDARAFAGNVADALSPVPLPRRLREGRRRRTPAAAST